MPRRARRAAGADSHSSRGTNNEQAITARIQATLRKIIVALQDQRDLRCDLSSTRTRALLLDSEYIALHAEYERSLAARDKLEALSRELARQNKIIDEESEQRVMEEKRMREEIVHRFNVAMMDINKKLARQSTSREQRDLYVNNLQQKLADLRERYEMREEHFQQQVHRKQLETRLAEARRREVLRKHSDLSEELGSLREQLDAARKEHEELQKKLALYRNVIREGEVLLDDSQEIYDSQKVQIAEAQAEAKLMQAKNAAVRKTNNATNVSINAMEAECRRLEISIDESRSLERRERAKVEALEKLCRQVTMDRSSLNSEILDMQDAWTNLKQEIEALKNQVGDSNRVFDVLQNIMSRESLDLAVSSIMKSGKTIEDVINDELNHLRVSTNGTLEQSTAVIQVVGKAGSSSREPLG